MSTVFFVSFMIGAIIGSYFLLRLSMFAIRKIRGHPNGAAEIALAGVLTLVIATIVGGYGGQDDLPDPQFLQAFSDYFGPTMMVTVLELVRFHRAQDSDGVVS